MKTKLFKKLAVLSLIGLGIGGLASCGGTGESDKPIVEPDKTGTVKLNFDNTQGNVTASATEGKVGTAITLTVTPNEGYSVKEVKANNAVLAGPNYAFELVEGENTVVVTFTKNPTISLAASAEAFKAHLTYTLTATVNDAPVQNPVVKFTDNASGAIEGSAEGNVFTFKATAAGKYKIQAQAYENATATTAFASATFDLEVVQGVEKYALVLDAANVKLEYKQGEAFTAAGLGVKKVFTVDGTKISESELTLSEVELSVEEGTVFTEVAPVEVTVKDVEEVAESAKFTVNVGADYLWQLKQQFKVFGAEGYETLVVSGGKLYDGAFVTPNAFINLTTNQAYIDEQVTQSGTTYKLVGKYDFEVDAEGAVSATFRGWAENANANTNTFATDYAKGYRNYGLFMDYSEDQVDALFAGMTYDETEKEAYTGIVTFDAEENATGDFDAVNAFNCLAGAQSKFGNASTSYRGVFAYNAAGHYGYAGLESVTVDAETGAVTGTPVGYRYFGDVDAEFVSTVVSGCLSTKESNANPDEALTKVLTVTESCNYSVDCVRGGSLVVNDKYMYRTAGGSGFVVIPEGKTADGTTELAAGVYKVSIAEGVASIGDAPTGATGLDQYALYPGNWYGMTLEDAGGWNLEEAVVNEDGTSEYSYTYLQTKFRGNDNKGYGSAYDVSTNVWGRWWGTGEGGMSSLALGLDFSFDADGNLDSVQINVFLTDYDTGKDYMFANYHTLSSIGSASVAEIDTYLAGLQDYVEPTPDPDPDPDPTPDPDPDPTPDPDPEGGEGGEGGESGGSEGGEGGSEGNTDGLKPFGLKSYRFSYIK